MGTWPHAGVHPGNYFTSFEHWGRTPKSLQTETSQSTKKSAMAKGNKGFPHNHCK